MKFIKSKGDDTRDINLITNIPALENFIEETKILLDQKLADSYKKEKRNKNVVQNKRNLTCISSLTSKKLIIKPAEKNLGIVVLNTVDYVNKCLEHLSSETYVRVNKFPADKINTRCNSKIQRSTFTTQTTT